jgi:CheY-like chemotaxis protein
MGGEITVRSVIDKGSTFSCIIDPGPLENVRMADAVPRSIEHRPAATSGGKQNLPRLKCRVLIVEDVGDNRDLIRDFLEKAGAQTASAENGRDAVEVVMSHANTPEQFDVILMDMQMPVMDGYEATRRILELAPGLPIIGQTAHAFEEERDKCLAAGMLAHIAKPIDPQALVKLVLKVLAAGRNG